MFEVTAKWTTPLQKFEARFFDHWEKDRSGYTAQLAHPQQKKPDRVEYKPLKVDASWFFYSVTFAYSVPDAARPKSVHGGGMHISFRHDEEEASRRLSAAINTLSAAIVRAKLVAASQYAWPDGSLYYWFASRRPPEEFRRKELSRLKKELEAVSLHPFTIRRLYDDFTPKGRKRAKKRPFVHRFGESLVRVTKVTEVKDPLRGCYKPTLHLVDFFNRVPMEHWLATKLMEGPPVTPEMAEAFYEGFTHAYGHHTIFGIHLDKRSPESINEFVAAYLFAQLLQVLTE